MAGQPFGAIDIPERFRKSSARQLQLTTVEESGSELLELMRKRLGLKDFSESSILDFGCGSRIPATLYNNKVPVKKYVGMDVDKELIQFLQAGILNDRIEFYHLDLHNKMYNYNPSGQALTLEYSLPLQDRFDVICLFSVFTHLNPEDADCLLGVLSRYIKKDGKLIFTCFIDDTVSGFDDKDPQDPLALATYTESFFRHLIKRNRFRVAALYPPTKALKDYWLMQHCFVCAPTANC